MTSVWLASEVTTTVPTVLPPPENRAEWASPPKAIDRIQAEQKARDDAATEMFLYAGTAAAIALPVSIVLGFVCTTLFLLNIRKRLMARLSISFGAISMLALTALLISMYGCAETLENAR